MNTKFVLVLLSIVFVSSLCIAAPPPPPPTGGPKCWPPPCVPIDGGISFLIAAGALYGGKKLYHTRKTKRTQH